MCFSDKSSSRSSRSSRYNPEHYEKEEIYAAPRPIRYIPPPYRTSSSSYRQSTTAGGQRLSYGSSYPTREPYTHMTVPRPAPRPVPRPVRTSMNPSKPSSKTVRYAAEPSPRRTVNTIRSKEVTWAPGMVQQQRTSRQYIN